MPTSSSSAQEALVALGARLRELRQDARLTGVQLAASAGWHHSKVSKIERGKQKPAVNDIDVWCRHCGAADQVADLVASLRAVEGTFVDWRRMERTGLRQAQMSVLPLWERTRQFRIYSSWVVPGPVQTRDYIAAILRTLTSRRDLPDDVDAAVEVRVDKQRVIQEGDHRFAVVLEESVLRTPIGGVEAMVGQMAHLLAVSSLPSVSLGIIPQGVDRSGVWPIESFWLFDDAQVSVELTTGHLRLTQPREVAMYAKVFSNLGALAVHGPKARRLITAAIDALETS